jgi:hypothetical protein
MVIISSDVITSYDDAVENGGGYRLYVKYREDKGGAKLQKLYSSKIYYQTYGSEEAAEHDKREDS